MQGDNFTIKVSAESMVRAAESFQKINHLELPDRKTMFADHDSIYEDAGWAWMPDYTLAVVAPGLLN